MQTQPPEPTTDQAVWRTEPGGQEQGLRNLNQFRLSNSDRNSDSQLTELHGMTNMHNLLQQDQSPFADDSAQPGNKRILIVDDDEVDFIVLKRLLNQIFGHAQDLEVATTWEQAEKVLAKGEHEIHIIDYSLGARSGIDLIRSTIKERDPRIFILLTGQEDRQVDLAATRVGALDYLVKGELTASRLERCLRFATEAMSQRQMLFDQADALEEAQRATEAILARAESSEKEYRWLAQHDLLTQVPNRMMFAQKLRIGMESASRSRQHIALMLLDLDRFKSINDTHGHQTGDRLLVEVARRLTETVRDTDVVARLGGDEFAMIINNLDEPLFASGVAEKLTRALAEPFEILGNRLEIGSSIGVALFEPRDTTTPEEIISQADAALYRAKSAGRGMFQFYDDALNGEIQRTHLVKTQLPVGISAGQFSLAFQPKICLRTGEMVGAEALARWVHPTIGTISPGEFIPAAEETGLISSLSDWIFEQACRTIRSWQGTAMANVSIALNLSAIQLFKQDIAADIQRLLERYELAPAQLEFEVTETAALNHVSSAMEKLAALRDMGIKVAIDDFGTGYSSLALATGLPSDSLKIDLSFVAGMLSSPTDAAAVNATIALAHSLGKLAIAEGVETDEQRVHLLNLNCDQAQGYLFSRPLPAADVLAWQIARTSFP
ncbi:MAG: EAL domain-containing protein [Minwuia sp.]|nr:EAL domain-containing protein [Minwuia sp.]